MRSAWMRPTQARTAAAAVQPAAAFRRLSPVAPAADATKVPQKLNATGWGPATGFLTGQLRSVQLKLREGQGATKKLQLKRGQLIEEARKGGNPEATGGWKVVAQLEGKGAATLTYVVRGAQWTQVFPLGNGPAPLGGYYGGYDTKRGRLLRFGGNIYNAQVWAATWQANGDAQEACVVSSQDSDGDGLAACADPDCAGICTPRCLPNLPCVTGPRCGDAICDGNFENYQSCPGDCPAPM